MARGEPRVEEVKHVHNIGVATAEFGIIGLGNMGANLALNIGDHGYRVAVWNHRPEKVEHFLERHGTNRQWVGSTALEEFVRAMSASLAYFDSYRSAVLPQNLTQAQRDCFGAHRYQRTDRPDAESVHTDWRRLIDDTGQRQRVSQEK